MSLNAKEKNIVKLLALVTEMERASENKFIFERQFNEFVYHLSEDEKEIINLFNKEKEKTDMIAFTLEQGIKSKNNNH